MSMNGLSHAHRAKLQGKLNLGVLAVPFHLEVTFSETLVQGECFQHWKTIVSLPAEPCHHKRQFQTLTQRPLLT